MLTMRDHCQKPNTIFVLGWLHFNEELLMAFLEEQTQAPKPMFGYRNFVHGETRTGESYHRVDMSDEKADSEGVDMIVHTSSLVLEGRASIQWKPSRHKSGELRVGNSQWVPNPIKPGTKEYLKLVTEKGPEAWRPKVPQKFRVRFVHD